MDEETVRQEIAETDRALSDLIRKRRSLIEELAEGHTGEAGGFVSVPSLETEGARVVYQGVEGAYSQQAAELFFGPNANLCSVPTFESAAAEIDEGRADFAVLPIENTTGGAVGDVLDLQMKYPCYTVAELDLPIVHVLLGLPGTELSRIDTVYSHPQGLAQCSDFLERHRGWVRIPLENTAASARRLIAERDPRHAAIASEKAGELYGLTVLQREIANDRGNTTRFIIATGQKIYREDAKKIRLCFECGHVTGALYRILSHFTYNSLNMTKIESRPIPGRNWEYRFFVDFEGNLGDPSVKSAIEGIREEAGLCQILGNF